MQLDVAAGGPQLLHQRIEGAEPGCGATTTFSSPVRITPSSRRNSASASRPLASMAPNALRVSPRSPSSSGPAWLHDHHRYGVRDHVVQLPASANSARTSRSRTTRRTISITTSVPSAHSGR